MFAGSTRLTIDDKGRLAIPARQRAQLSEDYGKQIAVTLGPECIEVYPAAVFRRIAEAIPKMPDRSKRNELLRMFVGRAVESEIDAQGRILVPSMLRETQKLGTDVVLIGLIDHFELWPEAQWTATTADLQTSYADAFAALSVS